MNKNEDKLFGLLIVNFTHIRYIERNLHVKVLRCFLKYEEIRNI